MYFKLARKKPEAEEMEACPLYMILDGSLTYHSKFALVLLHFQYGTKVLLYF